MKAAIVEQEQDSFFRHYLGRPVLDAELKRIGRVSDLAVRMGEEFPPVSKVAVLVQTRGGRMGNARYTAMVSWDDIARFEPRSVNLNIPLRDVAIGEIEQEELLLKKNIMDQQVVDDSGKKILRVNDIKLAHAADGHLRLVGVDTGMLGLLGRLGPMTRVPALARLFRIKIMQNIIMWDVVDEFDREMNRIKLGISQEMVKDLYNL
jgi:magnesium transporter